MNEYVNYLKEDYEDEVIDGALGIFKMFTDNEEELIEMLRVSFDNDKARALGGRK